MKKNKIKSGLIICAITAASMMQAQAQWSLTGNAGTVPGTNFIGTTDAKSLQIRTNGLTRIAVTSNGRVGIGVNTPTYRLDVGATNFESARFKGDVILDGSSANFGTGIIAFRNTASGLQWNVEGASNYFTVGRSGVGYDLSIFNNGNVGIGTGNVNPPSAKLDVAGNINASGDLYLKNGRVIENDGSGRTQFYHAANGVEHMEFNGSNTYLSSKNVYVEKRLSVGLNPSLQAIDRPFVVRDTTSIANTEVAELANGISDGDFHLVSLRGVATNNIGDAMVKFGMVYGNNGADLKSCLIRFHRGIAGNDGAISFSTNNDGSEIMRLTALGRVGIGTTIPGGQFELSLDQGRKPSTSTWTITSDARLKNIDGAYTKGLNEIMKLNTIAYHYKNTEKRKFDEQVLNTQAVGFSAQDVQKVFPEAVGQDEDGFLNLNIHPIIIAQVNAIKELGAANEAKDTKIAEMQRQLNEMQECLQSICSNASSSKAGLSEVSVSSLVQNQPNPFNESTVISYTLSSQDSRASILIRDLNGNLMKSINVNGSGKGQVTVYANELAQGTYTYSLVINSKTVDTKLMVITK